MNNFSNFGRRKQMATKIPDKSNPIWMRFNHSKMFERFKVWVNRLLNEFKEQQRIEKTKLVLLLVTAIMLTCIASSLFVSCVKTVHTEPQETETITAPTDAPTSTSTSTPKPTSTNTPKPFPNNK